MPTYEYECTVCGHSFRKFHGILEQPKIVCPLCGGKAQRRISSAGGFILKGSGFYLNDYKKSKDRGYKKAEDNTKIKDSEK